MTQLWKAPFLALIFAVAMIAGCRQETPEPQGSDEPEAEPVVLASTASVAGELGVPDGIEPFGIMVFAEGTSFMGLTDSDGRYTVANLPVGEYQFRAMRPDLRSLDLGRVIVTQEDLAAPQPSQTLLRVIMDTKDEPGTATAAARGGFGGLRGRVTTILPNDEANVVVTLEGSRHRTVTLAGGEWELLNVEPGDYRLAFSKTGYETNRVPVNVRAGQTVDVPELQLGATQEAGDTARTIFGQVNILTASGEVVTDYSGVNVVLEGTSYITTVDASGRFQLQNIPPGSYVIGATAPGFILEQKFRLDLQFVPAVEVNLSLVEDTTQMAENGTIFGRVLLEEEGPQGSAGIAVSIAGTNLIAFTNAAGDYEIMNIPPGTYDIVAMFSGYKTGYLEQVEISGPDPMEMQELTLEVDVIRPRVVFTNPADGARGVPIEQPTRLTIQFSAPMDFGSVVNALTITPSVGFSVLPAAGGMGAQDTIIIEMAALPGGSGPALKYKTAYTLEINGSAATNEGVEMREPFEMEFETGAAMVIATMPEDGDREARFNFDEPIRVFFNAPIDRESIRADHVRFRPSLPLDPNIYFREDPTTGWTVMFIQSYGAPDTNYRVTINRSAATVTGQRVENLPYNFSFKTRELKTFEEIYGTGDRGYDVRERERGRR